MTGLVWRWIAGALPGVLVVVAGCHHEAPAPTETKATSTSTSPATGYTSPPAPQVTAPAARTETPFEGEIQLSVNAPGAKADTSIKFDIKGDRIRSETSNAGAGEAHLVSDLRQKKAYAVVDSTKSYAVMDIDAKAQAPAVQKTGKVERVLGRDCEDWVITDAGERFEVCAAKGIAYFDPPDASRAGGPEPAWAAALTKEHAFPLRVVATDKAGKREFRAEATRIEPKRLDDALFKVPNDYRVMPMSKTVKVASIP
jgi:hypothetical protein